MAGETRVGIFAKEHIPAGTELTFDYQLDCLGNSDRKPCTCGASNCSGFIGLKPVAVSGAKRTMAGKELATPPKKKRRGTKKPPAALHEDLCFKCQDGGSLLMCDYKECTKAYHLDCLGHSSSPRGKWFCPYHHCDKCGKKSKLFCGQCPNSYCTMQHAQEFLDQPTPFPLASDGKTFVCTLHQTMQGVECAAQADIDAEATTGSAPPNSAVTVRDLLGGIPVTHMDTHITLRTAET